MKVDGKGERPALIETNLFEDFGSPAACQQMGTRFFQRPTDVPLQRSQPALCVISHYIRDRYEALALLGEGPKVIDHAGIPIVGITSHRCRPHQGNLFFAPFRPPFAGTWQGQRIAIEFGMRTAHRRLVIDEGPIPPIQP